VNAECVFCGVEIPGEMVETCRVTPEEAVEYGIPIGSIMCVTCFHRLKWPSLFESREAEDDRLDWDL
jgi:hypothetical protein